MKTITTTDQNEIEEIIRECSYCSVAMVDQEGNPYVVPMNFAYKDGVIYMHSGPEGRKAKIIAHNPTVCISFCEGHELVYQSEQIACSYSMKSRSVMCVGKVQLIEDLEEKRSALDFFMKQYTDNPCGYADPSLRNVRVWAVKVEEMSCKSFGLRPSEIR